MSRIRNVPTARDSHIWMLRMCLAALWLLAAFWIGRVPALAGYCLSPLLTILCAACLWRYWKEGKPAGFYAMRRGCGCRSTEYCALRLLTRSGRWSLGRNR